MKFIPHTLLLSALLACASIRAYASPWTLEECIAYAQANNLTVKARQYDVQTGEINLNSAKNQFLPTVSGNASQSWNFGRSTAEDNIKVSSNSSNFQWGVNAQLPLFDGLKNVRQLKTAKLSLTQLLYQSDAAREGLTLNVITTYLQVLLNQELMKVAETQVSLSKTEVTRQEGLVEAGKAPELDLVQARSQLAQDEVTLTTARNDYNLSLLDLKQLLLLPADDPMEIVPLTDNSVLIPDAENVYRSAMEHNSSILAKRQNVKVAESRIALAKSGWMPTLSFGAGIGSSYTHFSAFDSNSFGKQMRDNLAENIGFSLSIPIFDAFQTRNAVKTAQIDRMMADLELEQSSDQLYHTITQAYYQADAARKKSEASAVAEEATKAALDAMTVKYNYGKANATEFEQAKDNYIKACSSTVQAKYEYMVRAKILEFYARPQMYGQYDSLLKHK